MDQTGFNGDGFEGTLLHGLYLGTVVNNVDPRGMPRIKVRVPGIIDTESTWALPKGSGAAQFGANWVPPIGADVFVQFVNGRVDQPVWEPGPPGEAEVFPEFTAPDVSVFGIGPFRLIVDRREGQNTATLAAVVGNPTTGDEEQVAAISFDADNLSIQVAAIGAIQVYGRCLTDVDSDGDVQIKQRKITLANRPIN
jgi:hypothetical protein